MQYNRTIFAAAALMAVAAPSCADNVQIGPGERRLRGGTRLDVEPTAHNQPRDKTRALKNLLAK